jgi:hypothetical protein
MTGTGYINAFRPDGGSIVVSVSNAQNCIIRFTTEDDGYERSIEVDWADDPDEFSVYCEVDGKPCQLKWQVSPGYKTVDKEGDKAFKRVFETVFLTDDDDAWQIAYEYVYNELFRSEDEYDVI